MKKFLVLLAMLPMLLSAQTTDSWVNFAVQYDYYAPQESNFTFVSDSNGDTLLFHQPTSSYEYLDTTIFCNSGDYIVTLNDSYGDGWLSNSPAWFKVQNSCQGMILNFDPLTQQFFTLDTLVNILPCAPPTPCFIDTNATNYDSTATFYDGSCTYPSCGSFLNSNAYELCWGTQTGIVFEWESDITNEMTKAKVTTERILSSAGIINR